MKNNLPISFEFSPAEGDRLNDGWGKGTLYLSGLPYWYDNAIDEPKPIDWTWVDFLEFAAENWKFLCLEQRYPFEWLNNVAHPGVMWDAAEQRWERLDDSVVDEEEQELIDFERRHNLAYAWKGMSLPSLILLRSGNACWLCGENIAPMRVSFDQCIRAILNICEELAASFAGSSNPRVISAVKSWKNREVATLERLVQIATGLKERVIEFIQGGLGNWQFWDLPANNSLSMGLVREGPLLAAARMTAGIVDEEIIKDVLCRIREIPLGKVDVLNNLSSAVLSRLSDGNGESAHDVGYFAADCVRRILNKDRRSFFDIEDVAVKLGVVIKRLHLYTANIDAIAVWGSRGPCVILNLDREFDTPDRHRMTLAHELAHLVLDRGGGLPFCEVLGGAIDPFIEKRANAFAAELLLPRDVVAYERFMNKGHFGPFIDGVAQKYGVSKTVVCAQVYNSSLYSSLSRSDSEFVNKRLQDGDFLISRNHENALSRGAII